MGDTGSVLLEICYGRRTNNLISFVGVFLSDVTEGGEDIMRGEVCLIWLNDFTIDVNMTVTWRGHDLIEGDVGIFSK
eukprot:5040100-Karenia_brevis.AAC.1